MSEIKRRDHISEVRSTGTVTESQARQHLGLPPAPHAADLARLRDAERDQRRVAAEHPGRKPAA